jgi:hypothetical protein
LLRVVRAAVVVLVAALHRLASLERLVPGGSRQIYRPVVLPVRLEALAVQDSLSAALSAAVVVAAAA